MNLFDVYSLYDIEPVKGLGCHVYTADGTEYLDLYGGHAVISVGHAHPLYVSAISDQVSRLGFYSNSVQNSLQQKFADRLGRISGYDDYALFLCNSGAVAATDNPKIQAPFNSTENVVFAPLNDVEATERLLATGEFAGVIIEGIQGVAGIPMGDEDFMRRPREICTTTGTLLLLYGIQSGHGSTGRFFAHQ